MINQSNASGTNALYSADGGVGQQRWHSAKLLVTRLTADATVQLKVNGSDPPGGPASVTVTGSAPQARLSTQYPLVTGDAVSLVVDGGNVNFSFASGLDADEISA